MGIHDRPYYRDDPASGPNWDSRSPISIIIMICVGVFLVNLVFGTREGRIGDFVSLHASDLLRPWMWWRMLTYGFVHDHLSIGHIFWNMIGLWCLGRAVQERYGVAEFWRIYLSAIVVCGFAWLVLQRLGGSDGILLGASGAVVCIEMLFVLNYPKVTLNLLGVLPIPAWIVGIVLIVSNVFASAPSDGGPNIAYDVHLAGIVYAFAYFYGNWNFGFVDNFAGSWQLTKRKMFGPRLKAYKPDATVADAAEADRLLEKIHKSGQDSLNKRERKFLETYSKRVRDRQRNSSI